jgi:hypothetical protein
VCVVCVCCVCVFYCVGSVFQCPRSELEQFMGVDFSYCCQLKTLHFNSELVTIKTVETLCNVCPAFKLWLSGKDLHRPFSPLVTLGHNFLPVVIHTNFQKRIPQPAMGTQFMEDP